MNSIGKEQVKTKADPYKILLTEDEIPTHWYNILGDMKTQPQPTLDPENNQPVTREYYSKLYSQGCVDQEFSTENGSRSLMKCVICTRSGGQLHL
jgi:hypothetical protein